MEIFYSFENDGRTAFLDPEESAHCIRVLRHRAGDTISVVDGLGTMMTCRLADDSPKGASAEILQRSEGWGSHPYSLRMAVCPTKNNDRYEWFVEKATEIGVDVVVPVIGERSERRVFKTDRARKVALAAMKQSLKATLPRIEEPVTVKEFLGGVSSPWLPTASQPCPGKREPLGTATTVGLSQQTVFLERQGLVEPAGLIEPAGVRMICYCFEGDTERRSIGDVLAEVPEGAEITIMIGPEGDFSPEEAALALEHGFIPVHLGPSRLRTETAAVTAATACYLHFIGLK